MNTIPFLPLAATTVAGLLCLLTVYRLAVSLLAKRYLLRQLCQSLERGELFVESLDVSPDKPWKTEFDVNTGLRDAVYKAIDRLPEQYQKEVKGTLFHLGDEGRAYFMAALASRLAKTHQKSRGMSDVSVSSYSVEEVPRTETRRKQPITTVVSTRLKNMLPANPLLGMGVGIAMASAAWLVMLPLLNQFAAEDKSAPIWTDSAGVDWQIYGPMVQAEAADQSSFPVKSCPEAAREVAGYARGLGVSEEAVTGLCAMLDQKSLPGNKVDTALVGVLNTYDELLAQAGKAELEGPGGQVYLAAMTQSFEKGEVGEVKKSIFDWTQSGEAGDNPAQMIAILSKTAQILQTAGQFSGAAEIYATAHRLAADELGESHPTTERLKSLQTLTQLVQELKEHRRREEKPTPSE